MVSASPSEETPGPREGSTGSLSVENAILRTLAYVDVFDYPLTAGEIHRYLPRVEAPAVAVKEFLADGRLVPRRISRREGYYTLPGREEIVATRRRREEIARRLWPLALRYGRLLATLPFVRMVSVTGSLAVNNAEADADIDYLVVTANDRLWLCRALTILVVRAAALRKVSLCPNYFLSERALVFKERNLYTAHELAQMVPVSGLDVYRRLRRLNPWAAEWLPNATNAPPGPNGGACPSTPDDGRLTGLAEELLQSRLGARLEAWEMQRKMEKFGEVTAGRHNGRAEAAFSPNWCKGHFDGHARRVLAAYAERVRVLEESL